MWEASERYPDPAVRVLHADFNKYRLPLASVERLATGCRWAEGPVYFGDARCLLWSDIPNDRILRWDEDTGAVGVYRKTSYNANGNTRDRQGRLVTCEHGARRVTRTEYDGAITVLADSYEGKRLNSPNDVVVAARRFGLVHRPGVRAAGRITRARWHPRSWRRRYIGSTGRPARSRRWPTRSRDRTGWRSRPTRMKLYVVASRENPRKFVCSTLRAAGWRTTGWRSIAGAGTPDGFRVDVDGNLWCGWGMGEAELDGVRVFNPAGEPIGHITLPERCANLCFGGRWRNRLFMAASHGLYALYVNTQGVAGG